MRRSAVLLSGAVLWGLGCGDQADKATAPDAPVVWQLLGNRTTEVATKLAVHHDGIVMATGLELPDQDAVRIYELRDAVWTQLGSTLRGHVRGMVEFEESVWVGGYLYESENTVLNGLARWDGERWQPEGPTRPMEPSEWRFVSELMVRDDQLFIGTECGLTGGSCGVAEMVDGQSIWVPAEIIPLSLVDWNGTLVVAGVTAGDLPCGGSPMIYRETGGAWTPFDAQWYETEPCYAVASATVWSGSIVLTGYRLPGDDVSSVHTWDGVSWGNLGGRIPGEKVRAFGERLLCWSSSAILEWDGTDWQEVRKNAPGTIEDVAMLDGAVVICGRHELGGGYVAIAAP